jgi:hypothetical protein
MHRLRTQLLSFVMLSMNCLSLHSMEIVENIHNKQLLEIVAYNIPHEYEAQRALAGVNKEYNKIVEDMYRQDKKRIKDAMQEKNLAVDPERISWNKDFSRCTWVEKPTEHYGNYWILVLMGVESNNVIIKPYAMPERSAPVFYTYPRSYFTKKGEAFCHMYAYVSARSRITYIPVSGREIVQMKYDFSGNAGDIVCMIGMKDETPWMSQMLNYPYCVRDFFGSTDVLIFSHSAYGHVKQYHIRGVTVSNCYKGFEKYSPGGGIDYSGYNVLPEYFKNIMDDLFLKQQAAKNNDNKK